MDQAYLQTAFEIKTMCDELSRRLLRWHWEQQEGRTMRQLVEYVELRARQAPDYFGRMQELTAKTTWQQLDTTVCMRVLLDPGDGVDARPLRLLGAAPRPVVARQACNGLRLARNAAAHSTTLEGVAESAAAFAEAVEKLEDGYDDAVLTAAELDKYRKAAARAVNICREAAINQAAESEPPAAKRRSAQSAAAEGGAKPAAPAERKKPAASGTSSSRSSTKGGTRSGEKSTAKSSASSRSGSSKTNAGASKKPGGESAAGRKTSTARSTKKRAPARKKKKLGSVEWLFVVLAVVVLLAAVWLRGSAMGLLG